VGEGRTVNGQSHWDLERLRVSEKVDWGEEYKIPGTLYACLSQLTQKKNYEEEDLMSCKGALWGGERGGGKQVKNCYERVFR